MSLLLQHKMKMLSSGFFMYPVLELEEQFEASTTDHVQRQKETGKFLKKLNKNTPDFDLVWHQSLSVMQTLHDLMYVENTALTSRSLETLAEIYASFDLELQNFNKFLKKFEKSNNEVFQYYQAFSDNFNVNVFEFYSEDMKEHYSNALSRHDKYCKKYDRNEDFGVDYEDMLAYYKVALKKMKDKKKSK